MTTSACSFQKIAGTLPSILVAIYADCGLITHLYGKCANKLEHFFTNNGELTMTENLLDILCIHHLFEKQSQLTPNTIALCIGENNVSYKQLNTLSNQLAKVIGNFVITPNTIIGLCTSAELERVAALLAILKAGGACLALNHENKSLCHYQLKQVNANIIIGDSSLRAHIPEDFYKTIWLDKYQPRLQETVFEPNPISPTSAYHLACVVPSNPQRMNHEPHYISHRTLTRTITNNSNPTCFSGRVTTAHYHCLSSAAFYYELFATLCHGGTLLNIIPQNQQR